MQWCMNTLRGFGFEPTSFTSADQYPNGYRLHTVAYMRLRQALQNEFEIGNPVGLSTCHSLELRNPVVRAHIEQLYRQAREADLTNPHQLLGGEDGADIWDDDDPHVGHVGEHDLNVLARHIGPEAAPLLNPGAPAPLPLEQLLARLIQV